MANANLGRPDIDSDGPTLVDHMGMVYFLYVHYVAASEVMEHGE